VNSQWSNLFSALDPAWIAAGLAAIAVLLLIHLLRRQSQDHSPLEQVIRDEHRQLRESATRDVWELRDEIASSQSNAHQTLITSVAELGRGQREDLRDMEQRIQHLGERTDSQQAALRAGLEQRFGEMHKANDSRLGEMRQIVEEKLHSTLERRLGESFRQVSERLEAVQKGLGEMQSLATGVGELKRVLVNVKTRGTWGEVQLGALLDEILTPDQFARNVRTRRESDSVVEFAIRLPGDGEDIWLPVDAKFPQEDYQRLLDASEAGDQAAMDASLKALLRNVRLFAQDISDKYLDPPYTTDFAIMFLPTEGLYAEVLRQPGVVESLQRDFRVVVAGPTSLAAILNSLRLGFRTLAIEQRSSEVWQLLSAVKTEFGRFGGQLEKLKKQLDSAARTVDQTGTRTRAMARKLKQVEGLPESESERFLDIDEPSQD